MKKIVKIYLIGLIVVAALIFLFSAFSPKADMGLYEIHAEITDIEDNMQIIIENWDTGSRKDPLKDLTKEVNRLIKINHKLGDLIGKEEEK